MTVTVYVVGVFDLFHRGHLELLRRARALGDRLIVAINGDEFTASYKRIPVHCELDRLEIIRAIRFVDEAFVINEQSHRANLFHFRVQKVVHGDDWTGDGYLQQIGVDAEFVATHGIEMVYLPYWDGVSTSQIIDGLKQESRSSQDASS